MPFLPFGHPATIDTLWALLENGSEDGHPYAFCYMETRCHRTQGGLYFYMAIKYRMLGDDAGGWSQGDDCIPLEAMLSDWQKVWEVGKSYWNEEQNNIRIRQWEPWESREILSALGTFVRRR